MSQNEQLFFFQPVTHQKINLPFLNHPILQYTRMCFSSPPTSPDCMVFGIPFTEHRYPAYLGHHISIIRRGEVSWTDIEGANKVCFSSFSNPVFYKGALYCLTNNGQLGVFDLKERGYRFDKYWQCWKVWGKLFWFHDYCGDHSEEHFLVESDGELLWICMDQNYVRIFQLNSDNEIRYWEEVESLGDNIIFASQTGCISMQTGTMGNTIHLPTFDNEGNGLFYSLASRRFYTLGSASARTDLYDTKRMLHCAWIAPTVSEIYTEDELRWLPNAKNFIPSSGGRVKVKMAPRAHPSFVLANLDEFSNHHYLKMFGNPHNVAGLPEVLQMHTRKGGFGWLFKVAENNMDCLLFNPQTMEKIRLPQPPYFFRFEMCAISSSPNDPSCIVVNMNRHLDMKILYCRPGESEWTEVRIGVPVELKPEDWEYGGLFKYEISDIIGCQGKIYVLLDKDKLVEIDFDPTPKVCWDVCRLPKTSSLGTLNDRIYIWLSHVVSFSWFG